MRVLIIIGATLCASSAFAAPGCHIDTWTSVWGQDSQTSMAEKSGMPCIGSINKYAGVRSTVIAKQPANGTAWVTDNHHWAYKSRAGYSGADAFTVAIDGTGGSNRRGTVFSGVTNLSVNVTVSP